MTPAQAATALDAVADQIDTGMLVLTDGDQQWSYPWTLGGLKVDTAGTANAAYAVGRGVSWREQLGIWLYYHDVAPRFLFDTTAARALLAEVDREASQPVVDPTLKLEQGEVVIVPGQTGRVLDIATTLARLREVGGTPYRVEVPLAFQVIAPAELDPGDIIEQAETLLARQITLMTYDVLTDETLSWSLGRRKSPTGSTWSPGRAADRR